MGESYFARPGHTSGGSAPAPAAGEPDECADAAYSYLSASIGSSRDALTAGYIPKNSPTDAEKPSPSANDHHGSEIGNPATRCTSHPRPAPSAMPSRPPNDVRH